MEHEANCLHTEHAQLHEQSAAIRNERVPLRIESEQLGASRVEVTQAAAHVVADRESTDRWAAEMREQRSSIAASEELISRTRNELSSALIRVVAWKTPEPGRVVSSKPYSKRSRTRKRWIALTRMS